MELKLKIQVNYDLAYLKYHLNKERHFKIRIKNELVKVSSEELYQWIIEEIQKEEICRLVSAIKLIHKRNSSIRFFVQVIATAVVYNHFKI